MRHVEPGSPAPTTPRATHRLGVALIAVGLPLLTAAAAVTWPAAAGASETISYTYDARGRLKTVAHSGTVNNGKTTTYSLDKADNRTSKSTT
jgi:hypothetical protein